MYELTQMKSCFSQRDYVIKTLRRHFMQIFTENIFKECPWTTKKSRRHMLPNREKIRGATFAPRFAYLTVKTLLHVERRTDL